MDYTFIKADLTRQDHREALVDLVDSFVRESSPDNKGLEEKKKKDLPKTLKELPASRIYFSRTGETISGMALCYLGFSSFAVKPLLNIHDFYIKPAFRGKGMGTAFLTHLESEAVKMDCCKITLEVQESNPSAKKLYEKFGFIGSQKEHPEKIVYFLTKKCGKT